MKLFTILFILFPILVDAQVITPPAKLRYESNRFAFDGEHGASPEIQSAYRTRYYINGKVLILPTTCAGSVKPWLCTTPIPVEELQIGNNIVEVTIQEGPDTPESVKSNTLIFFYAVNQVNKEIITNTEIRRQSVIRCQPGSYQVARVVDATKLLAVVNGITNYVSNIVATDNAIYVFSCAILIE
jgi:hypothetical protein